MHLDPGPLVVVLVLAAAVLHATWNAMAHTAEDRLVGFALISTATFVIGGVMVLATPVPDAGDLGLATLSAAIHVAYMVLLLASYQVADLSRAYPLSRGTGVALVALASAFLPRAPLGPDVVVGTGLVVVGLVGVTLVGPPITARDRRGIATALATGVAIAAYTVVDGYAVSGGAHVVAYAGWLFLLQSWVLPVIALARRGRRLPTIARRQAVAGLGGGAVSLAAYGLVLVAQTSGALAAVAALRELSIALGVLIGAFVLHERAARKRLLPALVLTAGAVVLALGIG
jgi:drug/metabolite transporter (DMT)-like permease